MARTDTTQAAVNTARANLINAQVTFVTSTLPPLHTALVAAVNAMDSQHPQLADSNPEDDRFYRACVQYVNELIAKGRYSGSPLRYP